MGTAHSRIIIIIGEDVNAQICREDYGVGSKPIYTSEGEFKWCAFPLDPRPEFEQPDLQDPGGNPGAGGSDTPEADPCAGDKQCICEMEEEEEPEEPELCELNCAECKATNNQCKYDVSNENNQCRQANTTLASQACAIAGGLEMPFGRSYANQTSCIRGRTQGFPGITFGQNSSESAGWSITGGGTLKFEPLGVGGAVDVGYSSSGTSTTGSSTQVTYPPIPVDRTSFPDCNSEARVGFMACKDMNGQCESRVTETFGDSCTAQLGEQNADTSGVVGAAADSGSTGETSSLTLYKERLSTLYVYGPVLEKGQVVFRRTATKLSDPEAILRVRQP